MVVKIKTENGYMNVNLAEFFPTGISRVRKLFRLMGQSSDAEQIRQVREYLSVRAREAEAAAGSLAKERDAVRRQLEETERLRKDLKIREARIRETQRLEEKIAENSDAWIRELDYVCGTGGLENNGAK